MWGHKYRWLGDILAQKYLGLSISQLILRKIITIVATSRQMLKLKCTKFDFNGVLPQTPL